MIPIHKKTIRKHTRKPRKTQEHPQENPGQPTGKKTGTPTGKPRKTNRKTKENPANAQRTSQRTAHEPVHSARIHGRIAAILGASIRGREQIRTPQRVAVGESSSTLGTQDETPKVQKKIAEKFPGPPFLRSKATFRQLFWKFRGFVLGP